MEVSTPQPEKTSWKTMPEKAASEKAVSEKAVSEKAEHERFSHATDDLTAMARNLTVDFDNLSAMSEQMRSFAGELQEIKQLMTTASEPLVSWHSPFGDIGVVREIDPLRRRLENSTRAAEGGIEGVADFVEDLAGSLRRVAEMHLERDARREVLLANLPDLPTGRAR